MAAAVKLLGNSLVSVDLGKRCTVETASLWKTYSTDKQILGLYFSAQWCPPCQMFTPDLVDFFVSFNSRFQESNFKIVFVSSDEDEESFYAELSEMPWPALPFNDKERKTQLSKQFKVQSIPMLILIDAETGNVITSSGRDCVFDDPEGLEFPWPAKSFAEIMQGELLKGRDIVSYKEVLEGKIKGIYFSAKWCPPCNGFNEELMKIYRKLKSEKNFEVVYVSSDRSEEYFREYYADMEMPWLAIPFGDPRIAQISRFFEVEGIPTLILLDENDEVLNLKGRLAVSSDPEALNFPWPAPPAEELSEDNTALLNESPCLILFTADEDAVREAPEIIMRVAAEYRKKRKANSDLPNLYFFYEGPNSKEVAESVRSFAQIEPFGGQLAILNIPEEQLYVHEQHKTITEELIRSVVEEFGCKSLAFTKFSVNSSI